MSGVLQAEIRKVTTTRLWWIMLICAFVLGGAYAAFPATVAMVQGQANDVLPPFQDVGIVRSVYNGGNTVTRVLALVVGIYAMGSEYRYQTLAGSYLAAPRRLRLALAKAVSLALFGLLYGVASVLAGVLVGVPFIRSQNGSFFFDQLTTWRSLLLDVTSIALWTMMGFGIGILIKNLLVAMVVGIGFGFVVEPMVSWLFLRQGLDTALNLLPTGATNAMLGSTSPVLFAPVHPFPWAQALAVLAVWCLVPAIVGVLTAGRGDLT